MIKVHASEKSLYAIQYGLNKEVSSLIEIDAGSTLITNAQCEQYKVQTDKEEKDITTQMVIHDSIEAIEEKITELGLTKTQEYTEKKAIIEEKINQTKK